MPESSLGNLNVFSSTLGRIVLQPTILDLPELENASLLIYPQHITKETLDVGVEWAASTQTPIFCMNSEVQRFEREGFGAYRFHKLDGYKEFDFQGGSIEFFPANHRKIRGIRGLGSDFLRMIGGQRESSYHVVIRPKGENPILFLSSTHVESQEWDIFMQANPSHIIGSAQLTKHEWQAFSTKVNRRVTPAQEISCVTCVLREPGQAETLQRENPLWAVRTGSL